MSKKETLTNNGNTPKTITPPKANIADDFIQGQYGASSDILGGSGAYTATYGNTDFGESKYDNPDLGNTFIESGDYKYTRGAMQSTAEKWGIGLSRAALKLGTRTLNGIVSPVYGIGSAIKNWDINKIVDNDVTRANQEFEAKIDKEMPLYSTKAAEDAKGLGKLAYANTWAGSILDGISYSGAAMLSGGVYTKALSAASKLASLDKLGMTVAEAMGAATKIEDAADKTKFVIDLTNKAKQLKNGLNNGTIALIGASTEASSEAMSTGDEFEKQMLAKIEQEEGGISDVARARVSELKKSVMNSTYALQIPVIAGSNWLTFGKTMLGSTATEKLLAKTAARTDREAIGESYKASVTPFLQKIIDKTYGLRQVTSKAIPEGFEELEQFAVTKGVNDYYANKYYNATYDDFFSSMAKGVNDAMSEEGLENFIIGAISGGIFGNATQIKTEGFKSYKNPINEKSINETLDYLNSIKGSDAFKSQVQMQYRHANLSEKYDKSVDANNDFEINNNKSDMFINYVNHMVNAGKTQDLREELESYKNLSNQEFEEVLGIKLSNDALTNTKESVNSYIQKRLDKIDKIEQLSNTLDNLHPNLSSNIKDRFMYTAWTLEDAQDRVKNIQEEINIKLSKSFGIDNIYGLPALNVLSNLKNVDSSNIKETIKILEEDSNISPLIRQDVVNKVQDLVKLKDRQNQFIAEYKALENPKLQAFLESKDELVENQVSEIVNENETKEDTKDTTINPLDPNDPNNANPPASNVTGAPVAATVDPANPLAQWFANNKIDYNTSEKDLTDALNRDTTISAEDKGKIFADWTYNQGKQPVVTQTQAQPTPDQVLKDPKRPQSFLMTQTKDRDTALQSNGAVIGNFRGTNEDGTPKYGIPVNGQPVVLATFAEVQSKLKELIDSKENLNDHINFVITDSGFVLIFIDDMPLSVIDNGKNFKGTKEQEKAFFEIRHLFYNQSAKARTIEELNVNKALINFTANSLLNFTTNNEDTQTTLETLQQENPQIPFVLKVGANMLDPLNTDTDIYYDEESKGQTISSNESIANIQDGLHLEITENSYPQLPIKVRIAPHANLQEELDKVNSATTPEEKIAAVKAFNKEVFIALKPVEGVNRKISLFYDTKADIFALQVEEKTSGSKWGGETTKKTAEIILPNVSTESILEGLNNRQINGKDARALVESDIKYNNYIDEDNQIIPSRLSTPIGKEGLFKYDLQAQIVDNAVPVTSTVVTSAPVQQTPVQTSTTTPTDLEALKQTPEGKEIEKRRPTSYIDVSKDKKSSLETFRNETKREWDGITVITGDRMKNLYTGIKIFVEAYPEYKELLDRFVKKENGTIGITNNNLSFILNTLKKEGITSESELGAKINAKYDAELKALEGTTKTNEQKIAELRADEQVELLKAIPNIAEFLQSNFMGKGTTYGENQGNMPDDLYAIYKPIYDKYNKLITEISESKPTEKTWLYNIEDEADFATMNNNTAFVGKIKEDLINKWNQKLGTNFPVKPKSAQLSLFKSAVESYLNKNNPERGRDIVYSIGLEESTGITQQEVDSIKAILPKFISIEDIKTIAQNLKIKGIPYGAFKNKVIYLNTAKGKPGTAYHEAFHAVFRTMLTDTQIQKYLMASAKDFVKSGKNMQEEVNKLRETVADYLTKSDLELQTIVLEEHMADKFQAFAENKVGRETEPLLRQLFIKIKEFFKQLFRMGNELDMFYSNILKGAFVNATPISNVYTNSNDTVFKLLPNKFTATDNGFFTAQESRKIINSFAIDVYKFKTGKYGKIEELTNKSDEQILDYFINKRISDLENKGRDYADSFLDTNEVKANEINSGIDKELYLYDKENKNSSEINGYEVLTSSVLEKLKVFNFKNSSEDITEQEGGDENQEIKEKFSSQDAWLSGGHDSLSQTIKKYASFTTKTEIDSLTGENREVAIDDVTLYNGLTRILADTAEENMIAKLHYASESNPNVRAFYEQMIKDLGVTFNPEDGTITTPSNSNNYNIYRAFLSNFKKSRVSQIDILLGKTGLTWGNANQNDPAKVSLNQWENNLLVASVKDKASVIAAADRIFAEANDFIKPKKDNKNILDNKVELLKKEFAKIGINITTAYIKYSLLKQKSLLKSVQENPSDYLTKDQITFLNSYDIEIPINFGTFAPESANLKTYSIAKKLKTSSNPIDIYKKDEGLSELKSIAENNALFDESIGNFSFTNAEGERVHEIINKSYVLEAISKFKDGTYLERLINGTAVGLNETETKNNYFLKNNLLVNKYQDYLKDLKLNILSGIRDTNPGTNNQSKAGITFGKFDGRSYLISALTLFNNNGNKESGKYIFRQNEASNTAYVAELPKLALIGKNTMDDKTINDYFGRQFLNEFERIGREKKLFDAGKGTQYEKYNTKLTDRAFDFTEFQYLKDIMGEAKYQELVDAALNSTPGVPGLTDVQMAEVLGAINTYINIGFSDFLKLVDSYGLKFVDNISKEMLSDENLKNFYINDYIMSSSMNELLDGDYALSRKDKTDISKRNKSAMASGIDYGKGKHVSAIIKDIPVYVTLNSENNTLERVTKQGDKYFNINNKEVDASDVKEITSNDAQSYASQNHIMMGSLRMGRLDDKTKEIYKNIIQFTKRDEKGKVVRNVNIGNKNQSHLSDALASLNSKKTVAFDGVNALILKMSEFGLVRSSTSYIEDKDVDNFVNLTNQLTDLMFNKDDFESQEFRNLTAEIAKLYKPVPGMEYWHNLANNMDKHGVDHVATQSASKGATTLAEDSLSNSLDLSKSKFNVANNTKRLQVETPTGKKEIVFGSQILTIITSELDDSSDVNFLIDGKEIKNLGELRAVYNDAINDSRNSEFTKAIAVIKDLKGKALSPDSNYEGMIDTTELDEIVKRSLAASGADVQQMQYFEGGYNYNMIQMLVKAEQVILAHFSKGVLNQKVNGDKVSLLAGSGITVVRDINTKKVISHHEVVKNPSKYADKTKYTTNTTLKYNEEDKDGRKYSECILSQAILTRHGLKVGDEITEKHPELLKMFGYRIPTGDKQSAMSLKVVSLLPDYYNGVGIFPDEIVYLSGADFDIDSEFIQMPAFWINSKGEPVKFGTEKTNAEKFEAYKYYNKKYDKNFKAVLNNILSKDSKLTAVLNDKDLEQDQISAIKSIVFDKAYEQASIKLGLPHTEADFIKSGLQPTANYNNTAVDAMISILTNESLNEITNNTTSTDALKAVAKNLIDGGFIKQTKGKIQEKNKSAHDINGKFDANKKNSDGKNGIGIAANKIQQFAFLMSKIGEKKVKFNDESFKFEIAGQVGGTYQQENKEGQRIADNLNLLLNAFTDNAKDPIAGRLNLKFELLGGAMELIMQGMTFENTMKLINLPIIQEYGELAKTLKYAIKTDVESKFSKESIKIAAIAKILYPEEAKKSLKAAMDKVKEAKQYKAPDLNPISEKDIENILLDKEFQSSDANDFTNNNDVQLQALFQFLQVVDQNNVMSNINTFLKLNQGLDVSFTDLHDDLHKAIDTFQINNLVGAPSENLEVPSKPHINITKLLEEDKNTLNNIKRALVVERQVGQKIFIEQTKVFKNEFQKFFKSLNPSFIKTGDNLAKLSREFLGFLSVKSYISDLEKLKNDLNTRESDKEAINKRLKSINLGLVFNELNAEDKKTLAQQLIALKANPATRNNYIVSYFSAKINDVNLQPEDQSTYEADIIDTKSFVKESNETISLLIDSVKSLYSDSRTKIDETGLTPRDFVDNMLGYLMVKDNMTFKNNSVAKYLPVEMFGSYSKSLDNIIEALVTKSDKLSVKLDELGYNFRKLYAADLNSPWGTLQFMQVENNGSSITISENKEEITFKTKNNTALEIAKIKSQISQTSNEQVLADLQKQQTTLEKRLANEKSIIENKEVLDKLFDSSIIDEEGSYKDKEGKTVTYTKPAYIFPQFMTIRVGEKGESKTYELVGYSSDLSANKTVGMQQHNTNEGFATGESAVYRLVEKTGNKGVSIFSTGTYDNAVSIFSKVTKKTPAQREIDELSSSNIAPDSFESIESMQQKELEKAGGQTIAPVTQEAKKATINPYALTEDLENEISGESANVTEENVVDLTKKPLINEEKNVILENGKAALLDIVAKETLYLGGVEFSPNQYAQLSARINNATTIAELQELEDNINKCM